MKLVTPYTKINSKWITDLYVRPETTKLLKGNKGRTLFDINCSNFFFDLSPKAKETKAKINKWDLIKRKSFAQQRKPLITWKDNLLNEGKYLQMIWPIRDYYPKYINIHKYINSSYNSISNKQTTWLKNGQKTWITFLQRIHTDGQQAHEKVLDIANHKRNANQNHNEISPHTCQNGWYQKTKQNKTQIANAC